MRSWPELQPSSSSGLARSIGAYGLASHLDYPRVLSFISRRGEAFHQNQSFNGLLNRLLANGDSRVWTEHAFAPAHPWVYGGTLTAAVLLAGAALAIPWKRAYAGTIYDYALISLTSTMVSPVAWEHHYGMLVPIYGATVPLLLRDRPFGRWTAAALALAFVLTGQFLAPAFLRLSGRAPSLALSYVFAGAVVLWVALFRAGQISARPVPHDADVTVNRDR